MRTPVTGPQMYKIGPLKTDLTESVITYIRHQHVLQQDLTQPIYSDNPAPQARSTTFAPLEITQRQAAPVQTATDSALILDQATARISVQYDARATTPGGAVSVDMVSAEELKQNLIAAERYFTEQAYQQKVLGNIEHAADLIGIRDTLHTIYSLSLQAADLAYPGQNPANQIAKAAIGGLAGAVKGGADFVQGTQHLICHPQQTIQELENAVKRLDYFIFSLCSDNPQARDELRAGIQQLWDAPIEKKAELATSILVGFKVAPKLLGKGIGKIIDAVKEAAIIEKVRERASTIGKGIAETAADSKIAEAPVAVTPEGAMIPAEPEGEMVALMETEKPVQGQTTNLGVIADGSKSRSIITGYTETAIKREHIFSPKHNERGLIKLSCSADKTQAENEIIRTFQNIIKDVDNQGLLKAGGTNIIRTVINGLETEIKFDILPDGTIRSLDGYIGRTGRDTWFNMVTWDYKGV